jgi:hypothetical protein
MMKKEGFPFRPVFIVIISIIVFSCLIWLYNQSQNEVLRRILTYGICFGAAWLFFLAMAFWGVVSNAINERRSRIYQAQEPERLKQHQARFFCHICGKPSPQPYEYWESYGENGQEWDSSYVTDYNKPTELVQCAQCQKWTCPNADPPHLENGVCTKCLETPPKQE